MKILRTSVRTLRISVILLSAILFPVTFVQARITSYNVCYTKLLRVGGAFALRTYSLERLPRTTDVDTALISVYPRPSEQLTQLYSVALQNAGVTSFLANQPTSLVYVMPGDFFLTGLILEEGPRYRNNFV